MQTINPVLQGGGWGASGSNPEPLRRNPRRKKLQPTITDDP
ncbi:hypothetical protein [Nitrosomonas europaea]|nr:hypothetical protein [Nitrosomonas europaea]